MRTTLLTLLLVLVLVPGFRQIAVAQVARGVAGGAVGVAGGAMITLSVVVARARWQGEYLESIDDLIHWQSVPMILTPAVGVFFGVSGKEPFIASVIGSTSGLVAGAAVGAGLGWLLSTSTEWPWAGGVIGAGAGMTLGGLGLGVRALLRQRDGDGAEEPTRIGVRLPI